MDNDSIEIILRVIRENKIAKAVLLSPTEWIALISAIVLIVGWFVNSYLKNRNEIAKEKLKYRMETLNSCLDFIFLIEKEVIPLMR